MGRWRSVGLLTVAVAGVATTLAQSGHSGVYRPTKDAAIPWTINSAHTLVWNGQPYMPVGVRVDADASAIQTAVKQGVKDMIVDLPNRGAAWSNAIGALQTANARFLLRLDGVAPVVPGFLVAPQVYRLSEIQATRVVTMDLPGAKSALVVLSLEHDGTIRKYERVPVVDGKLTWVAQITTELPHALYVYPEGVGHTQVDWWEGMDLHRDEVMSTLRRVKPGPGLRGIVNPMGRLVAPPGRDPHVVPDSAAFRAELRRSLMIKYQSVDNVQRAWALRASPFSTLEELARLVPLWQGKRGVPYLWDPESNQLVLVENARSRFWQDATEVIATAATRRQERIVHAIRRVVDVPVVQEWNGWSSMYDSDAPPFDGVGARVNGKNPLAIAESACRATSTALRWRSPGWLLATDAEVDSSLDDVVAIGPRAVFYRTNTPEETKKVAAASIDASLAGVTIEALLYPENAANPASPQRLPLGVWWIPTPLSGNRIDLGPKFYAYRIRGSGVAESVIWAKEPGRYRLRLANAKSATFTSLNGQNPAPKYVPNGVEINLNAFPTIVRGVDDVPVPEVAYVEAMNSFNALATVADRDRRDATEDKYFFADFVKSFDQNPAGSITLMRQAIYKLQQKLGLVIWLEAENATNTNFSEVSKNPGCSGESALDLWPAPVVPDGGFYLQFGLPVTNVSFDVWLAAKIPADRRADVSVVVAGQTLTLVGEPTGVYANGYGWYHVGSVRVTGGTPKVRVSVLPTSQSSDLSVDCIVLTSTPFKPDGTAHPTP